MQGLLVDGRGASLLDLVADAIGIAWVLALGTRQYERPKTTRVP